MKRKLLKPIACMALAVMTIVTPLSASASSLARIAKVNVSNARLREEPGNSEVVKKLSRGTKLLYWGVKDSSYCKVMTTDGKTGYIYDDFLSNYGTVKKSMVYRTKENTPVYRMSGKKLKRNGSMAKGQLVLVYKTNKDWAYFKTIAGKSGYCKLSYLKDVF